MRFPAFLVGGALRKALWQVEINEDRKSYENGISDYSLAARLASHAINLILSSTLGNNTSG